MVKLSSESLGGRLEEELVIILSSGNCRDREKGRELKNRVQTPPIMSNLRIYEPIGTHPMTNNKDNYNHWHSKCK